MVYSKDNPSFLSPRQRILYQRLEQLLEKIITVKLPIRVEEIWLFGSFLRGKKQPKDADICLKFSETTPEYKEFESIFGKMLQIRRQFRNPKDALIFVISSEYPSPDKEKFIQLFSEWIAWLTWSKTSRFILPEFAGNWDSVTKRLLQKNIPRIHIAEIVRLNEQFSLKTDVVYCIWSKKQPDLYYNIQTALSTGNRRLNNLKELESIEKQFQDLKKKYSSILIEEKIPSANLDIEGLNSVVEKKMLELKKIIKQYGD